VQAFGDNFFVSGHAVGAPVTSFGGNSANTCTTTASGTGTPADATYTTTCTAPVASTYDEQFGFAGRASYTTTFMPDANGKDAARVHVGVSGGEMFNPSQNTTGNSGATAATTIQLRDRPELRVDGSRLVDTGSLQADGFYAYGAELAGSYKNAYLQGEYYVVGLDRYALTTKTASATNLNGTNEFSGWYVQGSWVVTGEDKPYKTESATYGSPKVTAPFDLNAGTFGALELKARYSFLDLNENDQAGSGGTLAAANGLAVRGGEQQVMGAGFNWYPNNNIRFMVDWMNVSVDKLSSNTSNLQVGQNYNALGIRTQFAF